METEVIVPPLGQTVDLMTLVAWYKKEGEAVTQGEMLFALETDKSTLDVEAPASGVLGQVMAQAGDEVQALSVIAFIRPVETVSAGQPIPPQVLLREPVAAQPEPLAHPPTRLFISPRARRLAEAQQVPLTALAATGPEGAIIERDVRNYLDQQPAAPAITPLARRMAETENLDWQTLTGSGSRGRITRADVAENLPDPAETSQPALPANGESVLESIPLNGPRTVIAKRMMESSAGTARVTLTAEADATRLVELRQQLGQDGVTVSYNDLFIFILGRALRDHPRLNASLDPAQNEIKVWRDIHIGLATDTERGLLVPVVRHVAGKGLRQLATETKRLIEQAQAGQCQPEDLRGSTFTLTNLGMFGIDAFTPLLNLPECAILGVGRIKMQPVMQGEAVVGRQMVWLSLTFDHRLIDGGPAARFLQRVVQLVEHPALLLS